MWQSLRLWITAQASKDSGLKMFAMRILSSRSYLTLQEIVAEATTNMSARAGAAAAGAGAYAIARGQGPGVVAAMQMSHGDISNRGLWLNLLGRLRQNPRVTVMAPLAQSPTAAEPGRLEAARALAKLLFGKHVEKALLQVRVGNSLMSVDLLPVYSKDHQQLFVLIRRVFAVDTAEYSHRLDKAILEVIQAAGGFATHVAFSDEFLRAAVQNSAK